MRSTTNQPLRMSRAGPCSVEGCTSAIHARGLCNKHYLTLKLSRRMKLCGCGCGGMTAFTYVWGHHTRLFSGEEQSRRASFQTGDALRDTGAGKSYRKRHQRHEHRVVAEQMLGRPLIKGEIVHHIDGDKRNNAPANLQVMTQSDHLKLHFAEMMEARRRIHGR